MSGKQKKPKRVDVLALAIARGSSIAAAARAAGYSQRHAARLLGQSEFAEQVASIRSELWSQASGYLTRLNLTAARRLKTLLSSRDEAVQLRAARVVLQASLHVHDAVEMEARIAALEERLEHLRPGSTGRRLSVRGGA